MASNRPRAALWLGVAGAALVLTGVALVALRATPWAPDGYGWFAYSGGIHSVPTFVVLGPRDVWGLLAALGGVACLAAAAGYLLGVRASAARHPSSG